MVSVFKIILILFLLIDNSLSSFLDLFRIPQVRTPQAASDTDYYALDFIGLVEQYGYQGEGHEVTTEDGYILTIFRVLPKNSTSHEFEERPVAFVQHGIAGSADGFVVFGPNMSIAFTLLNAGYDVWLGNCRGNTYSRRHKTLSPDDPRFWEFSFDEQGTLDISAMIDYVLHYTKQPSMTFIGHSVGASLIAILLSERSEYNNKMNLVVLLSPFYKWRVLTLSRFLVLLQIASTKATVANKSFEVFFQGIVIPSFFKNFIMVDEDYKDISNFVLNYFFGPSTEQLTIENQYTLTKYWPAGTSTRMYFHLLQQTGSGPLYHYDYEDLNLQRYGYTQAPPYNMSNIFAPIVIFSSLHDRTVLEDDVQYLVKSLPNAKVRRERIEDEQFGHLHYILAKDMNKLVYNRLLEILRQFRENKLEFA